MTENKKQNDSVRSGSGKEMQAKSEKTQRLIHFGILAAIVLLLAAALIRFTVWNRGTDESYDPNEDTSEFDTESLDYIQTLDPDLRKHIPDDGMLTMLCLGNAPFADDTGVDGLAEIIARKTGAAVYNCAFPDSFVSLKNEAYQESYPADALSFYGVTESISSQNYDRMAQAVNSRPDETSSKALETLKNIDFSKVDVLTVMYDISDYIDRRPNYDPNNDENPVTYFGALNAGIRRIQEAYPHIRIIVLSHSFSEFTDSDGTVINGDMDDLGNGTLVDYLLKEIDAAMGNGVSILDNYYGTITEDEKSTHLTDGYHMTKTGREAVADRLAAVLPSGK